MYNERQGKFDNFQYITAQNQKRAPSCFSKEKEVKLSEGKRKPLEIKNEKCSLCVFFLTETFSTGAESPWVLRRKTGHWSETRGN